MALVEMLNQANVNTTTANKPATESFSEEPMFLLSHPRQKSPRTERTVPFIGSPGKSISGWRSERRNPNNSSDSDTGSQSITDVDRVSRSQADPYSAAILARMYLDQE
jgi:hypothetical protein